MICDSICGISHLLYIYIVNVVYLTNIMIVIRGQNSDTERTSCCDSITVIVAITSTKIK